uniref:Uncharacterized protein n=1 Tax=Timema bartmani TaxID=61472 RepID=A0A7R9ENN7_9NEOP|nr:unnamed protein product [Timema bartmani]
MCFQPLKRSARTQPFSCASRDESSLTARREKRTKDNMRNLGQFTKPGFEPTTPDSQDKPYMTKHNIKPEFGKQSIAFHLSTAVWVISNLLTTANEVVCFLLAVERMRCQTRMRPDLRWLVLRFDWFSCVEHLKRGGRSRDELLALMRRKS